MLITLGCFRLLIFALPGRQSLSILAMVLIAAAVAGVLLSRQLGERVIRSIYKRTILRTAKKEINKPLNDFYSGLEQLRKSRLVGQK